MSTIRCPVCDDVTNSYGQPFASEWAVAAHIAGKIKYAWRDRIHKGWALQKIPGVDLSLSIKQLAEVLLWPVHQDLEAHRTPSASPTPLSLIHDMEVQLHQHIKHRLQVRFGAQEDAWWVEGVPLKIRQECAQRREGDPSRDEPYAYTNLIDLQSLLDKNWSLFESEFLRVRGTSPTKKEFLDHLRRVNEVRNRYSHPVRAPKPNSQRFTDDLALAARIREIMVEFCKS